MGLLICICFPSVFWYWFWHNHTCTFFIWAPTRFFSVHLFAKHASISFGVVFVVVVASLKLIIFLLYFQFLLISCAINNWITNKEKIKTNGWHDDDQDIIMNVVSWPAQIWINKLVKFNAKGVCAMILPEGIHLITSIWPH